MTQNIGLSQVRIDFSWDRASYKEILPDGSTRQNFNTTYFEETLQRIRQVKLAGADPVIMFWAHSTAFSPKPYTANIWPKSTNERSRYIEFVLVALRRIDDLNLGVRVTVQVGNEPDHNPTWMQERSSYVVLVRQLRRDLERAGLRPRIISAGITAQKPESLTYLATHLAGYADAIAVHAYSWKNPWRPEDILPELEAIKNSLAPMEMVITECGDTTPPSPVPGATPELHGIYIPRYLIVGWILGLKTTTLYQAFNRSQASIFCDGLSNDDCIREAHFGLAKTNGSWKPAVMSTKQLVSRMRTSLKVIDYQQFGTDRRNFQARVLGQDGKTRYLRWRAASLYDMFEPNNPQFPYAPQLFPSSYTGV